MRAAFAWLRRAGAPLLASKLHSNKSEEVSMNTVFTVLAVLLIVGLLPAWPYSASWGYYPSGTVLLLALVVLFLSLSHHRHGPIV